MKKTGYFFFSLLVACLLSGMPATAAPPGSAARLWNLQNADILSIINEVSLETGKNFAVDPRVSGKISLVSSKPVRADELYDIFLSVLNLLGYAAIPSGSVVKIVPNMESGEQATQVATARHPRHPGEVVVRVIALERVSASQMIPVIRPLLPQWSNVAAYIPGNVLVLVGQSANLARIVRVIHDIDQGGATDIDVIPLQHAGASQVTDILSRLQAAARSSGEAPLVSITADERSNSILIAGNRAGRLHASYLVHRLDIPAGHNEGNTDVIYLRYLQAKTFAPLLGRIAANMQGKSGGSSTTEPTASLPPGSDNTTQPKKLPENHTSIQAEPATNAIIVTAPPAMMRALRAVVAKLDIRPAEVLVEGIIVQVSQNDLRNLGIQWGTLVTSFGGVSGDSQTAFPIPGAGNIGLIPHTNIAAILSFLENQSDTNILSTPSLAVLDNHDAILEIGQDVPYQTGSYATTNTTATVTPFNTVTPKPVTLKLQVTPQINLGNAVRLKINLKNDSLQNPDNPGTTPLINTSSIKNSVIVNSEDVLVLGGLISNRATDSVNSVPVLGRLPVVGKLLFQQKSHKIEKLNLLVFIKPTILRTPPDGQHITQTKYEYVRERQLQWPEDLQAVTPSRAPHVLPPWKNSTVLPVPFALARRE